MNVLYILGYTATAILSQTMINSGLFHFLIFTPQGIVHQVFNILLSVSAPLQCNTFPCFIPCSFGASCVNLFLLDAFGPYNILMGQSTVMLITFVGNLCYRVLYVKQNQIMEY
jgi:hypothetical protein